MTETNMISGVGQSGISSANGTMMPTPGMGQQGQYLNFFTVLVLASVSVFLLLILILPTIILIFSSSFVI